MIKRPMVDQSHKLIENAPWVANEAVKNLFDALLKNGDELRIVGGAVRNHLLGQPVSDIDFACSLIPDEIISRALKAGLKTINTGIEHGTVTILANHQSFEVTTLRKDIKTDGRHAEVIFGKDWYEDALRRDFTINALYVDQNGALFDPLGTGIKDLSPLTIRFIGDPDQRIKEDYLRILRFYRLNATYNDNKPDADGMAATIRQRAGLKTLSAERIKSELYKLLEAAHAITTIKSLYQTGLLVTLLDAAPNIAVVEKLCAIEHHLGLEPNGSLRLAMLAIWHSGDVQRLTTKLRLSKKETRCLQATILSRPWPANDNQTALKSLHYSLGKTEFLIKLLTAWAKGHHPYNDTTLTSLYKKAEDWETPIFPVSGDDLTNIGIKPGPEMGKTLAALETNWLASDMSLTKNQLLDMIDDRPK